MKHRREVGLVVVLLSAAGVLCAAAGPAERDAVLTAYRAHCDKVRSVEFKATAEWSRGGQTTGGCECAAKYETFPNAPSVLKRFRFDRLETNASGKVRTAEAFDGTTFRDFWANAGGEREIGRSGRIIAAPTPRLGDYWMMPFYALSNWPLEWLFDGAEVTGPMDRDGRQVYEISAYYGGPEDENRSHNFRMYVDPAHDYAKCYSEWWRDDGTVMRSVEVKEFTRVGDIWLPSTVEFRENLAGGLLTTKCRIEYGGVNIDFADNDFAMEYPPGTTVTDARLGVKYTIPSDEFEKIWRRQTELDVLLDKAQSISSPNVGDQGENSPSPPATNSADVPRGRRQWGRPGTFIAAACLAFAVTMTVLIRRAFKRKRR